MFASKTILEHLARGAVGFGALVAAIAVAPRIGAEWTVGSLALVLLALAAFRGCPVCWTIGMVETIGGGGVRGTSSTGRDAPKA